MAVDSLGNIYISEYANPSRVRKFTSATRTVSTVIGIGASGPGSAISLNNPTGLHVDSVGNLYVADYTNNGRITKQNPNTLSVSTVVTGGQNSFHAWSDVNGNIYIAGRVQTILD